MIQRAVITGALESFLLEATEKPGGLEAPATVTYPYWVLFPLPGTSFVTDYANSWRQGTLPYQVTSVGQNYNQADMMADLVRKVMLDLVSYPVQIPDSSAVVMTRDPDTGPTEPRFVTGKDICSIAERFYISVDSP